MPPEIEETQKRGPSPFWNGCEQLSILKQFIVQLGHGTQRIRHRAAPQTPSVPTLTQSRIGPCNSANLAAIVGLLRVSFLIVRSSALSLARRRLLADLCSASLVFSRSLMASSMRLTASSKPSEARRQLRPNAVLNSSSWVSNLVMSTFCERTSASSDLYFIEFKAALRKRVMYVVRHIDDATVVQLALRLQQGHQHRVLAALFVAVLVQLFQEVFVPLFGGRFIALVLHLEHDGNDLGAVLIHVAKDVVALAAGAGVVVLLKMRPLKGCRADAVELNLAVLLQRLAHHLGR